MLDSDQFPHQMFYGNCSGYKRYGNSKDIFGGSGIFTKRYLYSHLPEKLAKIFLYRNFNFSSLFLPYCG